LYINFLHSAIHSFSFGLAAHSTLQSFTSFSSHSSLQSKHGLHCSSQILSFALQGVLSNYIILQVDYEATNDRHFIENKNVVRVDIQRLKSILLNSYSIAMVQADVMGHSMGGVLSRIHYGGIAWPGREAYKQDINFHQGDINKLITIDSVHYGSFLADRAIILKNGLPNDLEAAFLILADALGKSIHKGAVENLTTLSPEIIHLNTVINTVNPVCRPLVGDYVITTDLTEAPAGWGEFYALLGRFGLDTNPDIIPGRSDLVVSVDSQAGGIDLDPLNDIFNHHHNGILSIEVLIRTLQILNAELTDIIFENGFPTGTLP